jgi:Integrase core domain/HTH-like domain
VLGQHRSTQRRVPRGPDDEERLTADIVALACRHGRLGYRKIAAMLRSTAGWIVNDKRVERVEARIVIESWRRHYNTVRPHGSLGYKPPAPEVFIPAIGARAASQPRPATPPALAHSPSIN